MDDQAVDDNRVMAHLGYSPRHARPDARLVHPRVGSPMGHVSIARELQD